MAQHTIIGTHNSYDMCSLGIILMLPVQERVHVLEWLALTEVEPMEARPFTEGSDDAWLQVTKFQQQAAKQQTHNITEHVFLCCWFIEVCTGLQSVHWPWNNSPGINQSPASAPGNCPPLWLLKQGLPLLNSCHAVHTEPKHMHRHHNNSNSNTYHTQRFHVST